MHFRNMQMCFIESRKWKSAHPLGDKMSMLTYAQSHKPLRNIKMAIYYHQTNCPFNLPIWLDV